VALAATEETIDQIRKYDGSATSVDSASMLHQHDDYGEVRTGHSTLIGSGVGYWISQTVNFTWAEQNACAILMTLVYLLVSSVSHSVTWTQSDAHERSRMTRDVCDALARYEPRGTARQLLAKISSGFTYVQVL